MHFLMYLLVVALQAADSGAFVITLGKDTIGMERYTRTADRLVDDMVMRDRAPVSSRHSVGTPGADGLIRHIELETRSVVGAAVSPIHAVGRYTKDEVFVDLTRNGQTTTAHVATPDGRGALPFINVCYALYDQTGLRARMLGGSPVKVAVLGFGGTSTFDLTVTFPAPDSMGVAFERDAPTLFKVDAAGRIQGADGRLTTQKVIVTRVPTLDLEAYPRAFGNRPLGQLSPPPPAGRSSSTSRPRRRARVRPAPCRRGPRCGAPTMRPTRISCAWTRPPSRYHARWSSSRSWFSRKAMAASSAWTGRRRASR